MDERPVILDIRCAEPEGTFDRSVRPARLTIETLRHYWDNLKEFDVLFSGENSLESFLNTFLSGDDVDNIRANGLIWEVDDVGIIFLTSIGPAAAQAHFSFWDRRLRGREELLRKMVEYWFEKFGFHRITCEAPLYTAPWLSRVVERIGFTKEGRKREAAWYKGQWFDVNLYSILRHEVQDGIPIRATARADSASLASDSAGPASS